MPGPAEVALQGAETSAGWCFRVQRRPEWRSGVRRRRPGGGHDVVSPCEGGPLPPWTTPRSRSSTLRAPLRSVDGDLPAARAPSISVATGVRPGPDVGPVGTAAGAVLPGVEARSRAWAWQVRREWGCGVRRRTAWRARVRRRPEWRCGVRRQPEGRCGAGRPREWHRAQGDGSEDGLDAGLDTRHDRPKCGPDRGDIRPWPDARSDRAREGPAQREGPGRPSGVARRAAGWSLGSGGSSRGAKAPLQECKGRRACHPADVSAPRSAPPAVSAPRSATDVLSARRSATDVLSAPRSAAPDVSSSRSVAQARPRAGPAARLDTRHDRPKCGPDRGDIRPWPDARSDRAREGPAQREGPGRPSGVACRAAGWSLGSGGSSRGAKAPLQECKGRRTHHPTVVSAPRRAAPDVSAIPETSARVRPGRPQLCDASPRAKMLAT
jgi:hypothetical protein